jgi:alkylmercury lyase-like protein
MLESRGIRAGDLMNTNALDDLDHIEDLDWATRSFAYRFITARERPPTVDEVAVALAMPRDRVALAFQRLNRHHALFLEPGTLTIRMAHPFSGVPTGFRVRSSGHTYWANCAWDMLGIPAALHADAAIEAHFANEADSSVALSVTDQQVNGHGEVIHFPLPFHNWYDDLVRT